MTINIPKRASQILAMAAYTLPLNEWTKHTLFRVALLNEQKIVCRCAHGQIQWCGQGESFQQKLLNQAQTEKPNARLTGIGQHMVYEFDFMYATDLGGMGDCSQERLLEVIQAYEKGDPDNFNRSLFLAHYYAGRVGLSAAYNDFRADHASVIEKLKEAALLAFSEGN